MRPAKWTETAKDLNGLPDEWRNYWNLAEVSHRLGLEQSTIKDLLTRSFSPDDPRSAINPPAGRLGGLVGAQPMWKPSQIQEYRKLQHQRSRAQQRTRNRSDLPIVSRTEAAERGLVTMPELVERTKRPKSTLNKWIRQYSAASSHPFPAEIGILQRVPPMNMGPPKPLRDLAAVERWITEYLSRAPGERGGHAA